MIPQETSKDEIVQEDEPTDVQSDAQTEVKTDSAEPQTKEDEVSDQQKPEPEKKKGNCSKINGSHSIYIVSLNLRS